MRWNVTRTWVSMPPASALSDSPQSAPTYAHRQASVTLDHTQGPCCRETQVPSALWCSLPTLETSIEPCRNSTRALAHSLRRLSEAFLDVGEPVLASFSVHDGFCTSKSCRRPPPSGPVDRRPPESCALYTTESPWQLASPRRRNTTATARAAVSALPRSWRKCLCPEPRQCAPSTSTRRCFTTSASSKHTTAAAE